MESTAPDPDGRNVAGGDREAPRGEAGSSPAAAPSNGAPLAGAAPRAATHDAVLDSLRAFHDEAQRRDVALVVLATQWARLNPGEAPGEDDALGDRVLNDEEFMWLELARHGCTHIEDLSIPVFAASAGMTEFQARRLIRESLLLVFLLPRVWEQAAAGRIELWRARKLAEECWGLHPAALAYIDRNMSLTTARHTQNGRSAVIEEAKIRFMQPQVQAVVEDAHENFGVYFDFEEDAQAGLAYVHATMDLSDAIDLKAALDAGAQKLQELGSIAPLHVRHSWALGDLARASQYLPETPAVAGAPGTEPVLRWSGTGTRASDVKVYLHLTPEALLGEEFSDCSPIRVEGRGVPAGTILTPSTVQGWFTRHGAGLGHKITIRPVLDLADHIHVDAYEVPDRIKEQVGLRDGGCVFPWCTRKPRFTDCDHIIAWKADGTGGPTCSCNLAPLCRRHHRAKTHADNHKGSAYTWWTYESLGDGKYLWHGPRGTVLLRTNTGVHEVASAPRGGTRSRRSGPPTVAAASRVVHKITQALPLSADFHDRYPPSEDEEPFTYTPIPRRKSWRQLNAEWADGGRKVKKEYSQLEDALYFYGQWWDFCHGKT